jgi:uncharacterized membrane protein
VSDSRARRVACFLAAVGAALAGYLVYVHYSGVAPVCSIGGDCEKVQTSSYSMLAGIPVALLGLGAYLVILGASLLRSEIATFTAATAAVVGVGFSAWLTYVEIVKLEAICPWCVASAVLMAVLAITTVLRVAAGPAGAAGLTRSSWTTAFY